MKHFFALLFLALAVYIGWQFTPTEKRMAFRRAFKKHAPAVAVIFAVLIAGLVASFYFQSNNLL